MFFILSTLFMLPAFGGGDLPQNVLQNWDAPLVSVESGTRFAAIVEAVDETPILVEVFDGYSWKAAEEVFRIRNRSLVQTDLKGSVNEVLVRSPDQTRILDLEWELVVPLNEYQGPPAPPAPGVLPQEIKDLGVISRADWGARPTTCVTTEDDWYRMAIHHTAGVQENDGNVQEQIQWLQVYFQETRGYCDIAYQFLVGWDGSVWEGRPYDYYSAATGGGQNDGNAAISFVGCYDSVACEDLAGPHTPTTATLKSAHNLIYTLSQIEDIPTDSDHIKGHQDWPGNSTACPGDRILARIPDWFSPPGPDYSASLLDSTFAFSSEAPIVLKWGESVEGYLEFENTGLSTWDSNTRLAPLPRDEASPVYGNDWDSATRVTASAENPTPGASGRFSFSLTGHDPGVYYQEFSLLQEGVTWFDEDGGIDSEEITLRIVVTEEPVGADSGSDTGHTEKPTDKVEEKGGCACSASQPSQNLWPGFLAIMGALLIRRRR
jgi:MYXO-CTERM domain-containing protein